MIGTVLAALALASCARGPGIKAYDRPISNPLSFELLNPRQYSDDTERQLRDGGYERMVRSDPAAVIRALMQDLPDGGGLERRVAAAEIAIKTAHRLQRKDIDGALGYGLSAIEISQGAFSLPACSERDELEAIYNETCGAFASHFHQNHGVPGVAVSLPGPLRTYEAGWDAGKSGSKVASYFDRIRPASFLEVQGFDERYLRHGAGGAVVGYRRGSEQNRTRDPFMSPAGYAVALTSVVKVESSGRCVVNLYDLEQFDKVALDGRSLPLNADFTAPLATLAESTPGGAVGFLGMLKPSQYAAGEGLYQVGPYRKGKIPLVLVHGLMSSPTTWREICTACYADPFLRKHYQLLAFYYPTGYPIPRNAAVLRKALRAYRDHHDPKRTNSSLGNMVVIGHSMGGILTNYQIRPGGDALWSQLFTKPIEEIEMTAKERETLQTMAFFKANPDIRRAVFVCSPHRGSQFADYRIGRLGSRLINIPVRLLDEASPDLRESATDFGRSLLSRPRNSIDNLQVNNTVLTTILEQPLTYDPPFHSIIGDRGKGDTPDSSDGVVPYWSSHLEGAASEKIVPADHNATNHPDTVREVRRILYQHLGRTDVPDLVSSESR